MQRAPWVVQRRNNAYGEPPSDVKALSYYVATVLPIEVPEKAKLLTIRTSSLRLRLVVHWIEQLSDNWSVLLFHLDFILCRPFDILGSQVVRRGLHHPLGRKPVCGWFADADEQSASGLSCSAIHSHPQDVSHYAAVKHAGT